MMRLVQEMVIRRVGTSRSASNTISRHTVVATKDAVKEKQVQQTNSLFCLLIPVSYLFTSGQTTETIIFSLPIVNQFHEKILFFPAEVEWMEAEDPLFMLYTSGSTGVPKGVLHTCAGYMLYAATTFKYSFDFQEGDVYWCTADIGKKFNQIFDIFYFIFSGKGFHEKKNSKIYIRYLPRDQ